MLSSPIEYIVARTLPESILFMLAGFIFLNLKIDKLKILKIGLLFGVIVSAIRTLPISYGIHTILGMIVGGVVLTKIANLPIVQPVMATCGIFIALALSEGIYMAIANILLKISTDDLMQRNIKGAILTMPSLLIFMIIVIIMKFIVFKINSKSKMI